MNRLSEAGAPVCEAQAAADSLVALGSLVIDPHGRRWLLLGTQRGFTRSAVDGCWWYGDRFNPRQVELTQVSSSYVIKALDEWESKHLDVDSDPTVAQGLVRSRGLVAS